MIDQVVAVVNEHPKIAEAIVLLLLLLGALTADWVVKKLLLTGLRLAASRTKTSWDDAIIEHNVFDRLAHVAPAMVVYFGLPLTGFRDSITLLFERIALAAIAVIVIRAFTAFLTAVNSIYLQQTDAATRPIKGYLQVVALLAWIFGGIVAIAALLGKSPLVFLTGIGALSAVLLLVFKDTLLSLVASVQLTSNDMLRVGDWIEVPQHGADGDVTDIALHTVKVQNWDKTTTSVPTYALITHGFKNWRTMGESGGRRIRRAINIETSSIRHLTDDEVDGFAKFPLLAEYIAKKKEELEEWNRGLEYPNSTRSESRRLTNIGTLRAYIEYYLASRPDIHSDMTLLVRQMDPTPQGIPIQVYCFTTTTNWNEYEAIQSDIFDHLLAMVPKFYLRVFQAPSGSDFNQILQKA